MFNVFLIIQFSITLLLLLAVLIQKTGKQDLVGTDNVDTLSSGNNFLIKVTWVLLTLFFINSIILGNISFNLSKNRYTLDSTIAPKVEHTKNIPHSTNK